MKFRTDFVTNSSSSSFCVTISFDLKNGESVSFTGNGATGESGPVDYFNYEALVTVSPKQLGQAKDVTELIQLLQNGVIDNGFEEQVKIFQKSYPVEAFEDTYDAYDFIKKIKKKIKKIADIETITITAEKEGMYGEYYCRDYFYDMQTGNYTGCIEGEDFESEGEGGDICLSDLHSCEIDE